MGQLLLQGKKGQALFSFPRAARAWPWSSPIALTPPQTDSPLGTLQPQFSLSFFKAAIWPLAKSTTWM